jgi:hypothetical protein
MVGGEWDVFPEKREEIVRRQIRFSCIQFEEYKHVAGDYKDIMPNITVQLEGI